MRVPQWPHRLFPFADCAADAADDEEEEEEEEEDDDDDADDATAFDG